MNEELKIKGLNNYENNGTEFLRFLKTFREGREFN